MANNILLGGQGAIGPHLDGCFCTTCRDRKVNALLSRRNVSLERSIYNSDPPASTRTQPHPSAPTRIHPHPVRIQPHPAVPSRTQSGSTRVHLYPVLMNRFEVKSASVVYFFPKYIFYTSTRTFEILITNFLYYNKPICWPNYIPKDKRARDPSKGYDFSR